MLRLAGRGGRPNTGSEPAEHIAIFNQVCKIALENRTNTRTCYATTDRYRPAWADHVYSLVDAWLIEGMRPSHLSNVLSKRHVGRHIVSETAFLFKTFQFALLSPISFILVGMGVSQARSGL